MPPARAVAYKGLIEEGGHLARHVSPSRRPTMSNPCISSSKVAGTAVYNAIGDKLGSIDDVIIDKVSGQVRYAALEFGGFLGMGTDRYPIPWGMLKYDTGLDGYVVPLRKEQLEKAPRYEQSSRPEYTEEYGRKVYDYYGVAWQ
jgi:sporulation protein YlmC with PRC-barrel domain